MRLRRLEATSDKGKFNGQIINSFQVQYTDINDGLGKRVVFTWKEGKKNI